MAIKEDLKSGVKLAADAATDAVQAIMEKSRLRANASRIKQVIKSDTDLRNQAYIELGRYFYENFREQAYESEEALCVVIDKTSKRIAKATQKYVDIIATLDDTKLTGENSDKIKAIVAERATLVKEKAKATTDKAKAKVSDLSDKAKIKAQDFAMKTKETVADISYKAKDKVQSIKVLDTTDEEIEELIFGDEIEMDAPDKFVADDIDGEFEDEFDEVVEDSVETTSEVEKAEEKAPAFLDCDEESPEEFEF